MSKKVVIIGAGPAGLTAALEILQRTDFTVVIVESAAQVGGLSKTVDCNGNLLDIGGHRFFSRSDRVMDWWLRLFPVEQSDPPLEPDAKVFLLRTRFSRILYLGRFFSYPIELGWRTLRNLGFWRSLRIVRSYIWNQVYRRNLPSGEYLDGFFIRRFGRELYETFFKDYTQKVWGIPASQIKADWGAQRVKGLSIAKAIRHAIQERVSQGVRRIWNKGADRELRQEKTETSLIGRFLYPPRGPGQLWDHVAELIKGRGGVFLLSHNVRRIHHAKEALTGLVAKSENGDVEISGDVFISTMPIRDLIAAMGPDVAPQVQKAATGLVYRDFITVGVLTKEVTLQEKNTIIRDQWIYIQENSVRMGRLQIFNNWSERLLRSPGQIWLGLEYFCQEGDDLWQKSDQDISAFAISELCVLGILKQENVVESTVVRAPKAYPAYSGTYHEFPVIRSFTDQFANLFLIGRNGMHRYNNADHSVLAAMCAVDHLIAGTQGRESLWRVNTEAEYIEPE